MVSMTDEPVERKPPLGVMPERHWNEQRAADLARAIHDYISQGFIAGGYYDTLETWIDELGERWRELKHLRG